VKPDRGVGLIRAVTAHDANSARLERSFVFSQRKLIQIVDCRDN